MNDDAGSFNQGLTFAFASDLHSEFHEEEPNWIPRLPAKCDVLVLAGDLGVGDQAIHFLLNIAIALDGTHVVWIAGNHAFYRTNIDRQKNPYRAIYHEMRRIHFFLKMR